MLQEGKTPGMARKKCVRIIAIDNDTAIKAVWTHNLQLNGKETTKSPHAGYIETTTLVPSGGRCVRRSGGVDLTTGTFTITDGELGDAKVIADSSTSLMWVNEFNPSNKACLAIHATKSEEYNTSKEFCQKLDYAGHADWRDPTSAELSNYVTKTNEAHIFIGFEAPCKALLARDNDSNSSISTRYDTTQAVGQVSPLAVPLTANIGLRCVRDN